jgi:mitofusin 2
VLRLASWDLRERFRAAMDEREKEVKNAEELEKNASQAMEFFQAILKRTEGVREGVDLVDEL